MRGSSRIVTFTLVVLGVLGAGAPTVHALGLSVTPASVGGLAPGRTSASPAVPVVVTGLPSEAWSLHVDDMAGGATAGRMLRSAMCTLGVSVLAQRLHLATTETQPTTTVDRPSYDLASEANPVLAHGTTPDTLQIVFSQSVLPTEPIARGCGYSLTVRYTLVPG